MQNCGQLTVHRPYFRMFPLDINISFVQCLLSTQYIIILRILVYQITEIVMVQTKGGILLTLIAEL